MKKTIFSKKTIYIIACILIIAGAVMYFVKGFEFDLEYAKKDQITLANKTGFEISKIKEIVKEKLNGKEFEVKEVEIFKNVVQISSKEITEEERDGIVEKVNEEYGLELSKDNVSIVNIEHTRIKDIIKPYILPGIMSFAIVLLYFIIRYRKLGVINILLKGIICPIIGETIYFSIILLTRVPFGTMAIAGAIALYVLLLSVVAYKFEQALKEIKNKSEKN